MGERLAPYAPSCWPCPTSNTCPGPKPSDLLEWSEGAPDVKSPDPIARPPVLPDSLKVAVVEVIGTVRRGVPGCSGS